MSENSELEGKFLLDYGYGPRVDLVWSIEGEDSRSCWKRCFYSCLKKAKERLRFHGKNFQLINKGASQRFPIKDQNSNFITSYGVLHHIDDIIEILNDFK